jgi:mRNA interferase RelE/StbE
VKYRLIVAKRAAGVLRRLDRDLQRRIVERLDRLCENPLSPPLSDWVEGAPDLRKSRVGGWRILFRMDKSREELVVVAIRPRGRHRLPPIDHAALHHKRNLLQRPDIFQRVALHGDDIR